MLLKSGHLGVKISLIHHLFIIQLALSRLVQILKLLHLLASSPSHLLLILYTQMFLICLSAADSHPSSL